ncbi:hypothetical protein CAY91_34555, partial [Pseudomonas aeruginosa]
YHCAIIVPRTEQRFLKRHSRGYPQCRLHGQLAPIAQGDLHKSTRTDTGDLAFDFVDRIAHGLYETHCSQRVTRATHCFELSADPLHCFS